MPSPHQHCTALGSPVSLLTARAAVFSMRERHLSLYCLRSLSLSTGSADNRFRRQRNLGRLLLFCISPLYPARISHPGNTGKSDPRLFCPDSVTAAPAGAGGSEPVLAFWVDHVAQCWAASRRVVDGPGHHGPTSGAVQAPFGRSAPTAYLFHRSVLGDDVIECSPKLGVGGDVTAALRRNRQVSGR